MAGRYLLTGVQLGLIKGAINAGKIHEALELVDDIIEATFVGESGSDYEEDRRIVQQLFSEEE